MEDEWVRDIDCEVENVSQQVGGSSKEKDRQKPQWSSRKNVKHQSDSDSVEDSLVSDNEWHSDDLFSASDSEEYTFNKESYGRFSMFCMPKKCMISNGKQELFY